MAFTDEIQMLLRDLQRAAQGQMSRAMVARMVPIAQRLTALLEEVHQALRPELVDVYEPETDLDYEETEMDPKERERLLLFRDAIEDAGVARQARGDALAHLEQYYAGKDPDSIEVHSYARSDMRRQKPHYWPRSTAGTPDTPAPTGREVRKEAAQTKVQLTSGQIEALSKLSASERLTEFRKMEAAQRQQS
jgi:hypothetical protein